MDEHFEEPGSAYDALSSEIKKGVESVTGGAPKSQPAFNPREINELPANQPQSAPDPKDAKTEPPRQKRDRFDIAGLVVQIILCISTASAFGAAYWYATIAAGQKSTMDGQWLSMNLKTAVIR